MIPKIKHDKPFNNTTPIRGARDEQGSVRRAPRPPKPDLEKLLNASWIQNEAGYRYLAGR